MANYSAICTTNWWTDEADQSRYVAQYPSLGAWVTARVASGTLTDAEIAEIQGDDWEGVGHDTTYVPTINAVTSAANYIKITTIGIARHLGVWDESRYILRVATSGRSLDIGANALHFYMDGLQVDAIGQGNYRGHAYIEYLRPRLSVVHSNIFRSSGTGVTGADYPLVILRSSASGSAFYNNVLWSSYDNQPEGIECNYADPAVYNNTIYGCSIGIQGGGHLKNNLVIDCTTPYSNTIRSADYNAYDSGTDPGTNGIDLSSLSASDIFTDYSAGDFSLLSTAIYVRKKGANLTSDSRFAFSIDIVGQDRFESPDAWDLGAWHYSGEAVGDPVTVKILNAVAGTMIIVEVDADGTSVAAPFSIIGTEIDLTYEYFEDTLLLLRARKSSIGDTVRYLPLKMNAIVTSRGCTFYLSQVPDVILK